MDWNKHQGSGFVEVRARCLYLCIHGPVRKHGEPIVVCEAGHGAASYGWAAVQSQARQFARVLTYDRAGLGQSQPDSAERTASAMAQDLSELLLATGIAGPYLLVAHSYGGMLAREFLHLRDADVAGLILVDTITERYSEEGAIPEDDVDAVLGDLDYWDVTRLSKLHQLESLEWDLVKKTWPHDTATAAAERRALVASEHALASKEQFQRGALGKRPLAVIKGNTTRDLRMILEAGEVAGQGTAEQRARLRAFVSGSEAARERHQRAQLQLSSQHRYVVAEQSGHQVQLTEPGLVVSEIRAMLGLLSHADVPKQDADA